MRTDPQGLSDGVHVLLDVQTIDGGGAGRWGKQPSQDGTEINNVVNYKHIPIASKGLQ